MKNAKLTYVYQTEEIKNKLKTLFDNNAKIHMDVSLTRPKISLKNAEACIKGVYPNFFLIEENSTGKLKRHTLTYSDLVTGNIVIYEINA